MMYLRRAVLCGSAAVAACAAPLALLAPSPASAGPQAATNRVIVVFKNQEPGLPPTRSLDAKRQSAVAGVQAPVTSQMTASGATNLRSYSIVNAVSATVSPGEESQLKSNPSVSEVIPDQVIRLAPQQASGSTGSGTTATSPIAGACPAQGQVQLNPQALETINADSDVPGAKTARSLGITGAGVKVAFIADGLDINNPDFIRPDGSHVFFDYQDFSGEGTAVPTGGEEAFGDAGSIAAQGNQVYNVQNYSPLSLNQPCDIRVEGVAPGASLAGLDIFGAEDAGFQSSFLQAINYAVNTDHVDVINESLGNNYYPDDPASLDVVKQANDAAVAAGVVVTVSSGDAGVTSTIGTPATDPNVISAGATTTYRADAQDGYGGARFPGITGFLSNNISSFSSGGFEQDGQTVTVVAPGELNWSLCSTDVAMYSDCRSYAGNPTPVLPFGGTSESSPLTAGVAALVIQAYRNTHAGATPSPAVVKQIIASTASDIGAPAEQQGAGLIDAYKAVEAAESYQSTAVGRTLLASSSQLNATGPAGTPQTLTDTITNNGATGTTVAVSTRAIGQYHALKNATVTLSDTASFHNTDWQGFTDNYESVSFAVPPGQNRLNAAIAFQNAGGAFGSLAARVRMTLVDPNGNLAGYSVPQGDGNYGDLQITDPAPGTWTAYIFSRDSAAGGTTGQVVFGASSATYTRFGDVIPSVLHLAPGQSAPVTLRVRTPVNPGDGAGSILLTGADGSATTIPVTLRSLIPPGQASWTGTLTGGNGRAFFTGESFYYQINLPAGEPELNASVALADNPNNPLDAWLVAPNGEAVAYAANAFLGANGVVNEPGAQLHTLDPQAGTWTLILLYAPGVSGTAISEPFTVHVNENPVPAVAPGLPESGRVRLVAGQPYNYIVHIRNTGDAPEVYFLDARLNNSISMNLAALNSPDTTAPLNVSENIPSYLVPSEATSLSEQAATTDSEPIQFDSSSPAGDPDLASNTGTSVSASLSANPLSQGPWSLVPDTAGPFGATGATPEPVATSASVQAAAFDPAVSAPTGDMWLTSTNGMGYFGSSAFNPVVVGPNSSAAIPVTVTPAGPSGSAVSGTLYVDDMNAVIYTAFLSPNGNEVAAIPYSYKIR
jgi:subtilisin family serine protease